MILLNIYATCGLINYPSSGLHQFVMVTISSESIGNMSVYNKNPDGQITEYQIQRPNYRLIFENLYYLKNLRQTVNYWYFYFLE